MKGENYNKEKLERDLETCKKGIQYYNSHLEDILYKLEETKKYDTFSIRYKKRNLKAIKKVIDKLSSEYNNIINNQNDYSCSYITNVMFDCGNMLHENLPTVEEILEKLSSEKAKYVETDPYASEIKVLKMEYTDSILFSHMKWSNSEPKVSEGFVIMQNNNLYIIKDIDKEGIAYKSDFPYNADKHELSVLEGEYAVAYSPVIM